MIKIYKLFCKDPNVKDVYIGSTKDIKDRVKKHEYNCNKENGKKYHYNVYKFIRDNGGFDNWDVEELEECDEDNRFQKERYYIEKLETTNLNSNIPYREQNEYSRLYYKNNKEKENNRCKRYYQEVTKARKSKEIICFCGSVIKMGSLQTHLKSQIHLTNLSKKENP